MVDVTHLAATIFPMGTPLNAWYGIDCAYCTPDPWPSGKTPKFMRLTFSGIQKTIWFPPILTLPNRTFFCEQSPACTFSINTNDFQAYWESGSYFTMVNVYDDTGFYVLFSSWETPQCKFKLDNQLTQADGDITQGGSCTITPYDSPATGIVNDSYFCDVPRIKFDRQSDSPLESSYHIAQPRYGLRIQVLWDKKY